MKTLKPLFMPCFPLLTSHFFPQDWNCLQRSFWEIRCLTEEKEREQRIRRRISFRSRTEKRDGDWEMETESQESSQEPGKETTITAISIFAWSGRRKKAATLDTGLDEVLHPSWIMLVIIIISITIVVSFFLFCISYSFSSRVCESWFEVQLPSDLQINLLV